MERASNKGNRTYNSSFVYADSEFRVNMTKFSFSWAMEEKGRAQSRMHYTVYPYRVAQSKLTAELVFYDVAEYLSFWSFVSAYQRGAVNSANTQLRFKSSVVQRSKGGCDYGVALESVPFSVRYTDIAPKMTLVMFIMKDNFDYSWVSSSSRKGSEKTLVVEKVNASDVKSSGETSFASPKTKEQVAKETEKATVIDDDCRNGARTETLSFAKSRGDV